MKVGVQRQTYARNNVLIIIFSHSDSYVSEVVSSLRLVHHACANKITETRPKT
jgi:hypothetical protein